MTKCKCSLKSRPNFWHACRWSNVRFIGSRKLKVGVTEYANEENPMRGSFENCVSPRRSAIVEKSPDLAHEWAERSHSSTRTNFSKKKKIQTFSVFNSSFVRIGKSPNFGNFWKNTEGALSVVLKRTFDNTHLQHSSISTRVARICTAAT